jgi:hypothetical protein
MQGVGLWIWGAIVTVVVIVVLAVVSWQGGWWLSKSSVQHQYEINTQTQQYQNGLVARMDDNIQGYDVAVDPGQKKDLLNTVCTTYTKLTDITLTNNPDLVTFHKDHCPA